MATSGARMLFADLSLTAAPGDVLAVVGPNGAGKSTLLRVVAGLHEPDAGSVTLSPPGAAIGYLPQTAPTGEQTLRDYVRRRTGVQRADTELDEASQGLASGRPGADDAYVVAWERWVSLGAGDLDERLAGLSGQLGLDVEPRRPLGSLSGGQAARVSLLSVLASRFDVLLLDEPSNDLDVDGLALMTTFIRHTPAPVVMASHDRAPVCDVATGVVEIDAVQQRVNHYTGGWSAYVRERDLARRQQWGRYERDTAAREALRSQARQRSTWADRGARAAARSDEPDKHLRHRKAQRADAQSSRAARARAAAERLPVPEQPRKTWRLRYSLEQAPPSADVVASLSEAVVRVGGFTLGPLDLQVGYGGPGGCRGGERQRQVHPAPGAAGRGAPGARAPPAGRPGAGRLRRPGTLGRRWPAAADAAPRRPARRAPVVGAGAAHPGGQVRPGRPARRASLRVAVPGGADESPAGGVPGPRGEPALLDEPTNHLDVEAVEQLQEALGHYTGTLVLVTQDRRLLERVGVVRQWSVAAGRVVERPPEQPGLSSSPSASRAAGP